MASATLSTLAQEIHFSSCGSSVWSSSSSAPSAKRTGENSAKGWRSSVMKAILDGLIGSPPQCPPERGITRERRSEDARLFDPCDPCRAASRPGDRCGHRADLCHLDLPPGGARQAQGFRVRAGSEPHPLRARGQRRRARGRPLGPRLRLGNVGDRHPDDPAEERRARRLLAQRLRRHLPFHDPGAVALRRGVELGGFDPAGGDPQGDPPDDPDDLSSRPRPTR